MALAANCFPPDSSHGKGEILVQLTEEVVRETRLRGCCNKCETGLEKMRSKRNY